MLRMAMTTNELASTSTRSERIENGVLPGVALLALMVPMSAFVMWLGSVPKGCITGNAPDAGLLLIVLGSVRAGNQCSRNNA